MIKLFNKNVVVFALQILLSSVFIFSGSVKLLDLNAFQEALRNFNLLSDGTLIIVKYLLPFIEILLGLSIIFNFSSSFPALLSSFLLSIFTAIIIVKIFEGEEISCGCFGNLSKGNLDIYSVIRNLLLIVISMIISAWYELRKNENTPQTKIAKLRVFKLTLIANLIFYLSVQNIIFALQNNGLKSRLSFLIQNENILKKGELVKSFQIINLENKEVNVQYSDDLKKNTLLFLLKPNCSPCKTNLPGWENIYFHIDKNRTRIYPISLDKFESTSKYMEYYKISFPLYYIDDKEFLISYKTYMTPQTILIDNKAKVIEVWKGILDENQINQIINLINKKEG